MLCTCTLSVVPRIQRPAILLYRYTVMVMCCNIRKHAHYQGAMGRSGCKVTEITLDGKIAR